MKKVIVWLSLFLVGCTGKGVVENPAFDVRNTNTLEVERVTLTDTATVVDMKAYYTPNFWIQIAREAHLEADGQSYAIRSADGITLSEKFWMPESGEATFRLIFEPLPKGTKRMDFIEGEPDDYFKIWGIRLDDSRPKPTLPPAQIPEMTTLEEPVLKAGIATLKGRFLGYRVGMAKKLMVWYPNFLTGNMEEYNVTIQNDGTFNVDIPLWHITEVYLLQAASSIPVYLQPGETSSIEINLPEICREATRLQTGTPSLGAKYRFEGALADLNNSINNDQMSKRLQVEPASREEFEQMSKDICDMTIDEYKTYCFKRYEKVVAQLDTMKGLSEVHRQLEAMRLKHGLACQLFNYETLNYAYRREHQIPDDSVLVNRPPIIPSKGYFDFLPELIPNDGYFLYNSGLSYSFRMLNYINLSGKAKSSRPDAPMPDNRASLAQIYGTDKGMIFDLLAAQQLARPVSEFQPLTSQQLQEAEKLQPVLRDAVLDMNEQLKAKIEANKKKSGYKVDRANISDIPADEVFHAITSAYRGKVLFIDIWATWCGPCKDAMKKTEPIKQEYAGKDVVFIYLAGENSPEATWKQMIPDIKGEHYRLTQEQWDVVGKQLGVNGVPSYVLVDKEGVIKHFSVGFPGVDVMKEWINAGL